jgi:hypothetical protein
MMKTMLGRSPFSAEKAGKQAFNPTIIAKAEKARVANLCSERCPIEGENMGAVAKVKRERLQPKRWHIVTREGTQVKPDALPKKA